MWIILADGPCVRVAIAGTAVGTLSPGASLIRLSSPLSPASLPAQRPAEFRHIYDQAAPPRGAGPGVSARLRLDEAAGRTPCRTRQ